jgi:uncharacterized RDD family membrane protein YckC
VPPAELIIAPLWRRFVASLLDVAIFLLGIVGVGFAAYKLVGRVLHKYSETRPMRGMKARFKEKVLRRIDANRSFEPSSRLIWGLRIVAIPLQLRARNRRGPGARLLRLRRVDARSGGPVTVRSALIRLAVTEAWKELAMRSHLPREKRASERMAAIQPELKRIQQEHAHDPERLNQAIQNLYKQHNVNPARPCLWALLKALAPQLPALWSRRTQGLTDLLSGTVVIIDE